MSACPVCGEVHADDIPFESDEQARDYLTALVDQYGPDLRAVGYTFGREPK